MRSKIVLGLALLGITGVVAYSHQSYGQSRRTGIVETCRMGECDREYLLSTTRNRDGTVTAKTIVEYFNTPNLPWKTAPVGPPRYFTYRLSCAYPGGFIENFNPFSKQLQRLQQPNPHAAHSSCESDLLWAKICGRPSGCIECGCRPIP